jgi:hypothetical protein
MKKLINMVELSRLLANNDTSISANRIPKKYQAKVDSLINKINEWYESNNHNTQKLES